MGELILMVIMPETNPVRHCPCQVMECGLLQLFLAMSKCMGVEASFPGNDVLKHIDQLQNFHLKKNKKMLTFGKFYNGLVQNCIGRRPCLWEETSLATWGDAVSNCRSNPG